MRAFLFALAAASAAQAASFSDNFNEPDGPPANWTVIEGNAAVRSNALHVGDASTESTAYAGSPPLTFSGDLHIAVDVSFGPDEGGSAGRHGGISFYAQAPVDRQRNVLYEVDWVDRNGAINSSYRFIRNDPGGGVILAVAPGNNGNPGTHWEVRVHGANIQFTVDGAQIFSIDDSTYRSGLFGLWVFHEASADFRNVSVSAATARGSVGCVGGAIVLDGTASSADAGIASWIWTLTPRDGSAPLTFSGATVGLPPLADGRYAVRLDVTDNAGNTGSAAIADPKGDLFSCRPPPDAPAVSCALSPDALEEGRRLQTVSLRVLVVDGAAAGPSALNLHFLLDGAPLAAPAFARQSGDPPHAFRAVTLLTLRGDRHEVQVTASNSSGASTSSCTTAPEHSGRRDRE